MSRLLADETITGLPTMSPPSDAQLLLAEGVPRGSIVLLHVNHVVSTLACDRDLPLAQIDRREPPMDFASERHPRAPPRAAVATVPNIEIRSEREDEDAVRARLRHSFNRTDETASKVLEAGHRRTPRAVVERLMEQLTVVADLPKTSIRPGPHETALKREANLPPRDSHPPQFTPSEVQRCQRASSLPRANAS